MPETFSCALLLLAAGASTRMGRPKQLLPVNGKPMLRHVIESAHGAPVSPAVVVLGANAIGIAPCLEGLAVLGVVNKDWAEGMGSSLRAGMDALVAAAPATDAVIVALADQPDFSANQLVRLIDAHRTTGRPIAAAECGGVRGPPVLFAARFFPELRTLQGDTGARRLLRTYAREVVAVPFLTMRDLDTPGDYSDYLNRNAPGDSPALSR